MGQARDQSGRYVRLADGLANLASGAGTSADKRQHAFYAQSYETPQQIEAWYRTSWLARKLVDLPPFDMTREGRLWQIDNASVAKIMAEEKRLGLWDKVRQALVLGRLGGGAIVMGIAGDSDPSQPLNTASVRAKGLTYLAVFNRWQIGTGPMVLNPTDPLFGQPEYFALSQGDARGLRIHPSRVVAFRGKPIPALSGSSGSSWFWGDSEMMTAKDAVQNADGAMNGFASLIEEAKLDTVTIPGLTNYLRDAEGEALVIKRVTVANQIKSTHNARILDGGNGKDKPGETWETRQVSWAGMPQVIQTYLAIVAGAADIPATRFLSESPGGLNATGDSDLDNYYAMIGTRQEAMRALLEQIDVALIPSAGVVVDAGATFTFPPLVQKSEADEAETFSTWAAGIASLQSGGLIPTIALEKGAQNRLSGEAWLPGISEALGELSEEERFPSLAPPETGDGGEPVDPSAITEGGDPASIGSGGVDGSGAARRRAKDARLWDFNPNHVPSGPEGGQFATGGGSAGKKVAPSPKVAADMKKPGFKQFFAGSKMVDEHGNPMPLYHGTTAEFDRFDHSFGKSNTGQEYGGTDKAFYFTPNHSESHFYGELSQRNAEKATGEERDVRIMRTYVAAKNPLIIDDAKSAGVTKKAFERLVEDDAAAIRHAEANGHDAVVWPRGNRVNSGYTVAVMNPDLIRIAGVETQGGHQFSVAKSAPKTSYAKTTESEVSSHISRAMTAEEGGKKQATLIVAKAIISERPDLKKAVQSELRENFLPHYAKQLNDGRFIQDSATDSLLGFVMGA